MSLRISERYFFVKYLLSAWLVLCSFSFETYGQNKQPESLHNLKVGEWVPNVEIANILHRNGEIHHASMADYKNKLLILDFLHTRCGSCLHALPKMAEIQDSFDSKVTILPVTFEDVEYMKEYFKRTDTYIAKKQVDLPWVVQDTLLSTLFNYKLVSHLVWIYKGSVKAITPKEYVTKENIQKILDEEQVNWPVKVDILNYDYSQPAFQTKANQLAENVDVHGYSIVSGKLNGVEPKNGLIIDSARNNMRVYYINSSVLGIYQGAWNRVNPQTGIIAPNRIVWENIDSSKYTYYKSSGYYEEWSRANQVCYEATFPVELSKKECFSKVIQDINKTFGLNARWEKRKVNCLILQKSNDFEKIMAQQKTSEVPRWKFSHITMIVSEINSRGYDLDRAAVNIPILIDESDYNGDIEFLEGWNDMDSLKEQFKIRGFKLIRGIREIEMFVISN